MIGYLRGMSFLTNKKFGIELWRRSTGVIKVSVFFNMYFNGDKESIIGLIIRIVIFIIMARIDNIIQESINRFLLKELGHQVYQDVSQQAFDNEDQRLYKFRKQAEKEFGKDNSYHAYRSDFDNDNWVQLNNGKKLYFFDDDYKSLQDLYNGVKQGKLLIHARGMVGDVTQDMSYIEPGFSETLMDAYGDMYQEIADSKSEYYGEEIPVEYPELVFASDDFGWCGDGRNGVFFVDSEYFQKSLGDGMIQMPNGTICKYYEGNTYDYDSDVFKDEPICCEYGDWYSAEPARVVAVMNLS